jgi:hypothetical protein
VTVRAIHSSTIKWFFIGYSWRKDFAITDQAKLRRWCDVGFRTDHAPACTPFGFAIHASYVLHGGFTPTDRAWTVS